MTNKIDTVLKAITDRITITLPSDTVKNLKLGSTPVLSARSYPTEDPQCSNHIHNSINVITIQPKQLEESRVNEPDIGQEEKGNLGNINSNPRSHPDPLASIATEQIMRRKLNLRENANGGISNFTGRVKGMHVFVGNFTYVVDFMIVEDISSIIDPRLSKVVLGKPFVEISNMTHDPQERVVRFINRDEEVAYKMHHKIEQYNSLSNLKKEHTKSVDLRNEEDKRRGIEYVTSRY
nr:retrotransposon Orf1 [Tanacetum cinerariifolium]